ncbi:4-alpha-glucanotransferase [Neorhizobium sp. DT-125]|uniref:4-alpha-glucanotransferase n=1 Tax=Neorhizobium sp. DT-125 TaxID=3396163 RepID=UPI003F1A6D1C
MKRAELDDLARKHGIGLTRPSPDHDEVPISNETKRKILAALGIDLTPKQSSAGTRAAKSPARKKKKIAKSYLPKFLENSRVWGISLQLYELRSERNWGIGDFEDLSQMVDLVGALGADFIGLNPLHALFGADPSRCSPYEPSNRRQLNPLYIAVDKVPGFLSNAELEGQLETLRRTDFVDYVLVADIKLSALRGLWRLWGKAAQGKPADEQLDFNSFVTAGGDALRLHALFEAISFAMRQRGIDAGWQAWPAEYQDPHGQTAAEFAREHADEVLFHVWLQWLAHRQLMAAADRARSAGLRIGLYLDLAVGEAIDGSATWSERAAYISKATIGSPPDPLAMDGQDWHLAAFHPSMVASGKTSPYRRMVSAAMRYAGAIRIDHAAALRRLFLVPLDSRPCSGAYVSYPQDHLLKILADASADYQCLVIGEDLGNLPEGLQEDLAEARILSYRILSYERAESSFKTADVYPALALACISTHDHQTLAGWWRGADIEIRAGHGIVSPEVTERHIEERKHQRKDLREALEEAGAEPPERLPPKTATEKKLEDLVVSAHRFIAKTPSRLAAVRLADLTGEKRPTNVPGTSDSYPNWKPKLSVSLEDLPAVPLLQRIAKVMREERSEGLEAGRKTKE